MSKPKVCFSRNLDVTAQISKIKPSVIINRGEEANGGIFEQLRGMFFRVAGE
jgi:hypothetical protein